MLKKEGKQSKESIKALEQKLIDANGTIEQLKIQFQKLGQVKCSHSRDTQNVEQSVRKKRNKPDDESDGSVHPPLVTALQTNLVAVRENSISADQVQQQESHRPEDANSFRVKLANGKSMAETLAGASTPATAVSTRSSMKPSTNNQNSARTSNNSSTERKNNNNNNNNNKNNKNNNNRTAAPRRSKFLTGTGQANVGGHGFVAAIKRHHFFVGKCDPKATVASITEYVRDTVNCTVLVIEELSSSYTQKFHTNFRVTVEDIDSPKMLDPANWPRNIQIGRYFVPRAAKQLQPGRTSSVQTQKDGVLSKDPAQSGTSATQSNVQPGTFLTNRASSSDNNNSFEDDDEMR
jgi:hypothetical protein